MRNELEKSDDGVKKMKTDIVSILIASGADIHAYNDYALRRAAQIGHIDVVRLLLDAGANVHADDDCALRRAAQKNKKNI